MLPLQVAGNQYQVTVTNNMSKEITSRAQDYSQWYNDLVIKGELADYSAVRGCMVIKPYGFALWENMREHWIRCSRKPGIKCLFPSVCSQKFI